MNYVIKIGQNYIGYCNCKYVEVADINMAIKGPMHKLSNLVKNCVAPDMRKKCNIVPEDTVKLTPVVPAVQHTVTVNNQNDKSFFDDVVTKIKALNITGFDKEHSELSQRLSQIDQEITDVYHYIEFNNLNAADGYKAYKLLQEKLLKRRLIKDEFAKFHVLASSKVSDIFDGTLDKSLNDLANKTYTPRVLKELFVEGKD